MSENEIKGRFALITGASSGYVPTSPISIQKATDAFTVSAQHVLEILPYEA